MAGEKSTPVQSNPPAAGDGSPASGSDEDASSSVVFGTPPLMNATEAFVSVGYGVTVKYNSSYPTVYTLWFLWN